jgi:hypothetical protein
MPAQEALDVSRPTKFRGVTPYAAGSEALAALSPKERAQLVGGLRLLQRLGLAWWREVPLRNAGYLPRTVGIALGGCEGPQPPKSTRLLFEVDVV